MHLRVGLGGGVLLLGQALLLDLGCHDLCPEVRRLMLSLLRSLRQLLGVLR